MIVINWPISKALVKCKKRLRFTSNTSTKECEGYFSYIGHFGKIFSSTAYACSDYRHRLLPMNLEMQLFLKVKLQIWSEETINKAMEIMKISFENMFLIAN